MGRAPVPETYVNCLTFQNICNSVQLVAHIPAIQPSKVSHLQRSWTMQLGLKTCLQIGQCRNSRALTRLSPALLSWNRVQSVRPHSHVHNSVHPWEGCVCLHGDEQVFCVSSCRQCHSGQLGCSGRHSRCSHFDSRTLTSVLLDTQCAFAAVHPHGCQIVSSICVSAVIVSQWTSTGLSAKRYIDNIW